MRIYFHLQIYQVIQPILFPRRIGICLEAYSVNSSSCTVNWSIIVSGVILYAFWFIQLRDHLELVLLFFSLLLLDWLELSAVMREQIQISGNVPWHCDCDSWLCILKPITPVGLTDSCGLTQMIVRDQQLQKQAVTFPILVNFFMSYKWNYSFRLSKSHVACIFVLKAH